MMATPQVGVGRFTPAQKLTTQTLAMHHILDALQETSGDKQRFFEWQVIGITPILNGVRFRALGIIGRPWIEITTTCNSYCEFKIGRLLRGHFVSLQPIKRAPLSDLSKILHNSCYGGGVQ